jgi:hypothetical protein
MTSLLLMLALLGLAGCSSIGPAGPQPQPGSPTEPPAANTTQPQPSAPTESPSDVAGLVRGEVFISSQELLVKESYPLQVSLHIAGSLPTPCHQLKVDVGKPDIQNQIAIDAYSLVDPNQNCIQVLKAFDETIPLDSYSDGTYTVTLNGQEVGEFTQ